MTDELNELLGFSEKEDPDIVVAKNPQNPNTQPVIDRAEFSGNSSGSSTDSAISQMLNQEQEYPDLMGRKNGIPDDYIAMHDRLICQYKLLPKLNFDELYAELSELSVKSCPTPTLQVLNLELEKVQGAKDRLSEIFIDVLKNHTFRKRAVDILRDSWSKFSLEKSADRRKGEAAYIVSDFEKDYAIVEALLKSCVHVLKNLDSLTDNLSRRITVIQLQLKLHDMGRGALPDFDFDKTPAMFDDISSDKKEEKTTIVNNDEVGPF